jgi:VanZ family protein
MFLRHNLPGISWAVLILIVCSMPQGEFPAALPFKHFDKTVHFFLYAFLSLFLIVGFKKQFEFRLLRKRAILYSFLFSFSYGLLIEMLQQFIFTTRSFDVMDLVANFSGTIFGIFAFFIIYGKS